MSYFNDNEDYLINHSRPTSRKPKLYLEDYKDVLHEIKPCPKCGKAPVRNNCGPEYQGVSCFDCNVHADYDLALDAEGSKATGNDKLISAMKNWNDGKFENFKGEEAMTYTEGPWKANDEFIESDSANYVIARCNWVNRERAEADARRIVACVNACQGITTEALEGGAGVVKAGIEAIEALNSINPNPITIASALPTDKSKQKLKGINIWEATDGE